MKIYTFNSIWAIKSHPKSNSESENHLVWNLKHLSNLSKSHFLLIMLLSEVMELTKWHNRVTQLKSKPELVPLKNLLYISWWSNPVNLVPFLIFHEKSENFLDYEICQVTRKMSLLLMATARLSKTSQNPY